MKKAFTDVKSFVTILFAMALVVLLFITIFKSESMFKTVFLLFTNLCTAVFTYFFAKAKKEEEIEKKLKEEIEKILKEREIEDENKK